MSMSCTCISHVLFNTVTYYMFKSCHIHVHDYMYMTSYCMCLQTGYFFIGEDLGKAFDVPKFLKGETFFAAVVVKVFYKFVHVTFP